MTAWPSVYATSTVQNSPIAAAAETVIATLPVTTDGAAGVLFFAMVNATIGTNGVLTRLRIRPDLISNPVSVPTQDTNVVAANLYGLVLGGYVQGPEIAARNFLLTLQITSGSANTVVNSLVFAAIPQF